MKIEELIGKPDFHGNTISKKQAMRICKELQCVPQDDTDQKRVRQHLFL